MMAREKPKYIVCDLCDEGEATTFCNECQSKVCEYCKKAHVKQKLTKDHNLADVDQVKLFVLKVSCSLCDGQAEKFCLHCNVCLCTACAESHHKQDDKSVGDKADPTRDSSQTLSNDSTQTPLAIDVTDVNKQYDVLCDLCEEERAGHFCEDCQSKLGDFCEASHKKQKATKNHNITPIQLTKLNKRHSKCSKCDDRAGTFCTECNVHLCTKCSNDHHILSDTLTPGKKIINTNQDIEKPLMEERMPYKNQIHGSRSSLVRVEHKICPDDSSLCKSELSTNKTRTSSSNVDPSNGQNIEERPGTLITKTLSVDSHTEKPKKETDRPGKPTVTKIYSDSVNIVWNSVQQFKKGDLYQVRLETVPEGPWKLQDYEITNVKIKGLKPNTSYLFKVRWVKSNGEESIYSEKSDIITTTLSFASKIVGESKLVKKGSGELDVYELPREELLDARNESANSKRFDIGPRSMNAINEKTIMLVGATGSGKSTFLDLLANYVFGVRLDDPFRFTVISDEDRKKRKDEAQAQTDFISCYSFNKQAGTRLNYRLNVIDTPGFGDVRGVEKDKKIVEEIRQLFGETGTKGIQSIDAVCFLLKAPDVRLTEFQMYIFKGVLSLFSQDIEENICAIITFADGGEPKVLAALQAEKITFNKIFRINNSALFSDPSNNSLNSTFWNMGLQSLEELFNHINTLEPKSIQLSKEVLNERHLLEETYQELQKSICDSIGTIEELNSEMNTFKDNEKIIENNKDFKYTIKVKKEIKGKLSDDEWATNCLKCENTCHGNCTGMLESVRNLCWVMRWKTGTCSKCLCDESDHKRENYRYFTVKEEVEKMYSEKLEHYQKATGKNLHLADVLDEMEDDIAVNTVKIIQMLKEITNCMNRLNEIALRPNVSGMSNPIDQIIHDEENAIMPKEDRITILKKFRDIASGKVILQDTSDKRRHWKYFNS